MADETVGAETDEVISGCSDLRSSTFLACTQIPSVPLLSAPTGGLALFLSQAAQLLP